MGEAEFKEVNVAKKGCADGWCYGEALLAIGVNSSRFVWRGKHACDRPWDHIKDVNKRYAIGGDFWTVDST